MHEKLEDADIPLEKILSNLKLMEDGKLTLAGLLVFGRKPQEKKPQFMIKVVLFPAIYASLFLISGSISSIDNLSDLLQVCLDAGAKKVMIPSSSASKISTVPPDLFSKFQISFYEDPIDALYKSLALS